MASEQAELDQQETAAMDEDSPQQFSEDQPLAAGQHNTNELLDGQNAGCAGNGPQQSGAIDPIGNSGRDVERVVQLFRTIGVQSDLIEWFETNASNVHPAVFQSAVQYVFSAHQHTPGMSQPMRFDSKAVSSQLSEPPVLQGDSSDPPLEAWLDRVRQWLSLAEIPANKQFLHALSCLSPQVVTAVFRDYDTIMQEAEQHAYTFDDFCNMLTNSSNSNSSHSALDIQCNTSNEK